MNRLVTEGAQAACPTPDSAQAVRGASHLCGAVQGAVHRAPLPPSI